MLVRSFALYGDLATSVPSKILVMASDVPYVYWDTRSASDSFDDSATVYTPFQESDLSKADLRKTNALADDAVLHDGNESLRDYAIFVDEASYESSEKTASDPLNSRETSSLADYASFHEGYVRDDYRVEDDENESIRDYATFVEFDRASLGNYSPLPARVDGVHNSEHLSKYLVSDYDEGLVEVLLHLVKSAPKEAIDAINKISGALSSDQNSVLVQILKHPDLSSYAKVKIIIDMMQSSTRDEKSLGG